MGDRASPAEDVLGHIGRAVPPGSTALVANLEPAVEVIDGEMRKLDGEVTRRPLEEVLAGLEAAEEAADAAAKEARRVMREMRKKELTEELEERIGRLKDRLHIS